LSGRGTDELALTPLSNAVRVAPQFALALCEMGYCYEKPGRYPEAVATFDTVLQRYPSPGEAAMNRNRVLEKRGKKR